MPKAPTSSFLGKHFDLPDVGRVRVAVPSPSVIQAADQTWPDERRSLDWHHSWRWHDILAKKTEQFALVDMHHEAVAFWCSDKATLLSLPRGKFYRLDYVEIRPSFRGTLLGVFLLGFIAGRAMELGAAGMVLTAFPAVGLEGFYEKVGATRGAPTGWNYPRKLVPFTFEAPVLAKLKEGIDGFLV